MHTLCTTLEELPLADALVAVDVEVDYTVIGRRATRLTPHDYLELDVLGVRVTRVVHADRDGDASECAAAVAVVAGKIADGELDGEMWRAL